MTNNQLDDALGIMRKLRPGIECVVRHPDAGGPCERPATMTVWNLQFCEVHGAEAETSAVEEYIEDTSNTLEIIADAERSRFEANPLVVCALGAAEVPGGSPSRSGADVIREAYPLVEGRIDSDTSLFDYGDPLGDEPAGCDGPHDWWSEAHLVMTKAMREAHERGLSALLKDLELVRAAAQLVQAEEDLERRWVAPRLAAKGKSLEEWREEMGRRRPPEAS